MKTENLSTLKIHKLTQAQYEREREAGRLDANALYLTPDETVSYIPTPAAASVGQLLAVKAVDANGVPTEWGLVTISLTTDENGVIGLSII